MLFFLKQFGRVSMTLIKINDSFLAVLQTSRLHGEKIATCGIFLRKKKDNFLTKIFKNFYNLCINVERRINKHVIYYHCTAVTEKMQVFRTDFLFLTIMSHKKYSSFSSSFFCRDRYS